MKATIDANVFKQLIENAKKFIGNNDRMKYIYLEFNGDTVTATALDGYRVSVEKAKLVTPTEPFECFIKPNIPKITKTDRVAKLELDGDRLLVTVGENITGYVQPQNKEYYNTKQFIADAKADEPKASVWVNPRLLKEALESCKTVCDYKTCVKLEISSNPRKPIKVWYGQDKQKDNLKLVLPVNHSEE